MRKEQVNSLGDADIFFLQEGCVGFFDSFFPKDHYQDEAKIFKRHYFMEANQHMGYYIPIFENCGPGQAFKLHTDQRDHWVNHPNLVKLMERL